MDKNKKIKLAAPWITFYREIEALFKDDPEINVIFDEDDLVIRLWVENAAKADALNQLLPAEKSFGNVTVKISVIPANMSAPSRISLIETAFKGNPAFAFTESAEGIFTNPIHYVVFTNKVVQYYNDDLSDFYGNCSTLYQYIADDVIGSSEGICFCTDIPKD